MEPPPSFSQKNGFSLIVTVTVLILLSLIAVGLLSLSTTVLRSSNSSLAQLEAQANARLALQLAIGQLQEAAGPDRRITAPANLLNSGDSAAITGVWESMKVTPQGTGPNNERNPYRLKKQNQSSEEPNGEFVTWLNSDSYGGNSRIGSPTDNSSAQSVRLLNLPKTTIENKLEAKVLNINNGAGGVAWATIDESVKARFNLGRTENFTSRGDSEENIRRDLIRNPESPGIEELDVFGEPMTRAEAGKIPSFDSGILATNAETEDFREKFHDITPWSLGVLSNPVDGGLKKDLTVAFENDSDPTRGTFLYSQDDEQIAPGEPYMSTLREYYRLYYRHSLAETQLKPSIPVGYSPFIIDRRTRSYLPQPTPVDGSVIAPVVSRVNVVISLISREGHGHWPKTVRNRGGDPLRTGMVYLIYTPVITLYNPYNSPLNVSNLTVSFKHLPLGFKFFRGGAPQTNDFALLSQLHGFYDGNTAHEDEFKSTLTGDPQNRRQRPITLAPGESRLFGLNHPANTRWGQMTNYLWKADQAGTSRTLDISTAPGYNDGNSGFIVDWLIPNVANRTPDAVVNVFAVKRNDTVNVAIAPTVPTARNGDAMTNFTVNVSASINDSPRPQQIGAYRYTYANPGDSVEVAESRLREAFELGEHPELGRIEYPYMREKPFSFRELYQPGTQRTPVENWTGPKQVAVFSIATRTSHDSLFATKPGRDTSFVHNVLDMDITSAHPAQMPMELSFLPVLASAGSTNNVGSVEVWSNNDPRTFFFSGWSVDKGFTNYPSIEVPRTPVTNLVQFRNAHLASSGHLPLTGQTVGDSHAHPMLPEDRAIGYPIGAGNSTAFNYSPLDHAWMANNSLYDHFYLSGLRNEDEFRNFLEFKQLPYNRNQTYIPANHTVTSGTDLFRNEDAWTTTAAFQFKKGAFNVNSTSVEAWKAILSSSLQAKIPVLDPTNLTRSNEPSSYAAFPRQLDSSSGSINVSTGFLDNQVRWTGFRDLQEDEIQDLAERIVDNVRARGPFTSMSEFVNRQLIRNGGQLSLHGALEQAIEDANLNRTVESDRFVTADNAADFEYPNPDAAMGDTEAASAAYLTQSDLMGVIGNSLTVRGDTFVVRAYGDSKDKAGRILAAATCEAVVQRVPDYLVPEDRLGAKPAEPKENIKGSDSKIEHKLNERFGRRFVVRSFRWLSQEEV